ncbi:hypothetical protein ES703_36414 [subsurface metagenome]
MAWGKRTDTVGANDKGKYDASFVTKKDDLGNTTDIIYGSKDDFDKGKHAHVGFDPSKSAFGKEHHPVEKR